MSYRQPKRLWFSKSDVPRDKWVPWAALLGSVFLVAFMKLAARAQSPEPGQQHINKPSVVCDATDANRSVTTETIFGVPSLPAEGDVVRNFIKAQWALTEGTMVVVTRQRSEAYYLKDDLPLYDVTTRYSSYKKGRLASVRYVLTSERKVMDCAKELERIKRALGEPAKLVGPSRFVSAGSVRRFYMWRFGGFQVEMEHVTPVREGDLGKGIEYRVTLAEGISGSKKSENPTSQPKKDMPKKARALVEAWCGFRAEDFAKPPMPETLVPCFSEQGNFEIDVDTRGGLPAIDVPAGVRFSRTFSVLKGKVRAVRAGPVLSDMDTQLPSLTSLQERLAPLWGKPSSVTVLDGSVVRDDCEDVIMDWGKGKSLYLTRSKQNQEETQRFSLRIWHRQLLW